MEGHSTQIAWNPIWWTETATVSFPWVYSNIWSPRRCVQSRFTLDIVSFSPCCFSQRGEVLRLNPRKTSSVFRCIASGMCRFFCDPLNLQRSGRVVRPNTDKQNSQDSFVETNKSKFSFWTLQRWDRRTDFSDSAPVVRIHESQPSMKMRRKSHRLTSHITWKTAEGPISSPSSSLHLYRWTFYQQFSYQVTQFPLLGPVVAGDATVIRSSPLVSLK